MEAMQLAVIVCMDEGVLVPLGVGVGVADSDCVEEGVGMPLASGEGEFGHTKVKIPEKSGHEETATPPFTIAAGASALSVSTQRVI